MQKLPPESQTVFQSLFVSATSIEIESNRRQFEIKKSLNLLQKFTLKNKLTSLSQQISRLESRGQHSQLKKVESRYNRILTKLSQLKT